MYESNMDPVFNWNTNIQIWCFPGSNPRKFSVFLPVRFFFLRFQNQEILEPAKTFKVRSTLIKIFLYFLWFFFTLFLQEEKVQGQQLNKSSKKLLSEQYSMIFSIIFSWFSKVILFLIISNLIKQLYLKKIIK
jgi:hypothetical protein